MYNGKRKNISTGKKINKERKSAGILMVYVRLFDVYFLLKNLMKFIKIYPRKESIKICILLNIRRLNCKFFN